MVNFHWADPATMRAWLSQEGFAFDLIRGLASRGEIVVPLPGYTGEFYDLSPLAQALSLEAADLVALVRKYSTTSAGLPGDAISARRLEQHERAVKERERERVVLAELAKAKETDEKEEAPQ